MAFPLLFGANVVHDQSGNSRHAAAWVNALSNRNQMVTTGNVDRRIPDMTLLLCWLELWPLRSTSDDHCCAMVPAVQIRPF